MRMYVIPGKFKKLNSYIPDDVENVEQNQESYFIAFGNVHFQMISGKGK